MMDNSRLNVWTTGTETSDIPSTNRSDTATSRIITRRNYDQEENNLSRVPTANGNNKYPINNPSFVAIQSKFRRKYYHKFVFIVLLTIILILLITIICLAIRANYSSYDSCETKECLRSASNLLQSMDLTIDPCEDFYGFTCGNWAEEHPRPDTVTSYDWFSEKQSKIIRKIRKYLQENETNTDPESVNKAKIMYKACVDTEKMNKLGVEPIFDYLREYKLPLIPSFLNKNANDDDTNTSNTEFDWIESIVKIKKSLELDLFIGFDIFPDPANRTINRLAVGTPETGSSLPFNNEQNRKHLTKVKQQFILEQIETEKEEEENNDEEDHHTSVALTAYIQYIKKVVTILTTAADPDMNLDNVMDNITDAAIEIIRITKNIYKLTEDAENLTKTNQNPIEDFVYVTIDELQNVTDEFVNPKTIPIWKKYFTLMMMSDSNEINENYIIDWETEQILTSKADLKYLQEIIQYITETSSLTIEFYLWWNVVEELVLHTTSNLRELHNDYTRILIKTEGTTTRSLYCTNAINSLLGMAVSYSIIDKNFLNETKPKVELMLMNIRKSFNDLVKKVEWMDDKTKLQTVMKSSYMKSYIGFPEWIMNKTKLDNYYKYINVNSSTHLNNMMEVIKWKIKNKLSTYKLPNDKFEWATSPSNVNAFHTFQSNTITIPIAILQFPFYDLGLEALNYGAIGTILGHELTHGFDDSGRMFDKCGNMRQWWTNKTVSEYVNRTSCFIKQYGNYYLSDVKDYINGELTLGENIADNGGLREAYYAYKLLIEEIGNEKSLPGFENYSHMQLFFIAFGNLWCETYTEQAAKYALEDSHCPGQIRLKGVLSNSQEFSEAFNCKKGSGMFPSEKRCKIW